MSLGDKLSRLRKENNYTQEQLADILGVSRQAISKWESDVAYPETDKLIRLSVLYHVTLDYLVRDDATCESAESQQRNTVASEKVNKLVSVILRFAPLALYALWALLLWAFYATSFIGGLDKNLYQWFGSGIVFELQPTINALISLGVISAVYIAALGIMQRFANKKVNLIANIGCFALQIAVLVCAMSLIGTCKSIGLESGKVVVVVATLTGVFALLQAVLVTLDYFFNRDAQDNSLDKKGQFAQKTKNWFKLHKVVAIIIACVLFVGIVLSVVLPLTVGNIFRASKVSRIKIGDSPERVKRVLGKPIDLDSEVLSEILGDDTLIGVSTNVYLYCSPEMERMLKNCFVALKEIENIKSTEVAVILLAKLNKMVEKMQDMEFKYIEVYFGDDGVEEVEYNAKVSVKTATDAKWYNEGHKKQKINLIPSEIPLGETPYTIEMFAQIFYADGSYRLSRIEDIAAVGNSENGWTVSWLDVWGSYSCDISQGKQAPDERQTIVEQGKEGNATYVVKKIYRNGKSSYSLTISGEGELEDKLKYAWSTFTNYGVTVINIGEGITNVPNFAFKNFTDLEMVNFPDSLTTIGAYAFSGCEHLTDFSISDGVTTIRDYAFYNCKSLLVAPITPSVVSIGNYAFYNCSSLREIKLYQSLKTIGRYAFANCPLLYSATMYNTQWRLTHPGVPDPIDVTVDGNYDAAEKLSETYVSYSWSVIID